jgi:hypothetical protein
MTSAAKEINVTDYVPVETRWINKRSRRVVRIVVERPYPIPRVVVEWIDTGQRTSMERDRFLNKHEPVTEGV